MTKINNLLWKLLSVVIAFLSNATNCFADDEEIRIKHHGLCGNGNYKNYYVKSCNGKEVGINWLRNATTTNGEKTTVFLNETDQSAHAQNVENFRKYIRAASTETKTISINEEILNAEYQLKELCSPYADGNVKIPIVCEPCPNAGVTDGESPSVNLNYNDNSVIGNWKFYTIADCFFREFTDEKGIYYFINENKEKTNCYYNPGTTGYYEKLSNSQNTSDEN